MKKAVFLISLDFEMIWGMLDRIHPNHTYLQTLYGVPEAIDSLLALFSEYEIAVTWATVGFLFAKNVDDLHHFLPSIRPEYKNRYLNPYLQLNAIKKNYDSEICFAPHLIRKISQTERQEIGSHTFSHFYTLEAEQGEEAFQADLSAASQIAQKENISISSLVFPRNQVNPSFLHTLKSFGIQAYRGNEDGWMFKGGKQSHRPKSLDYFKQTAQRAARLMDSYIKIGKQRSTPWYEFSKKTDVLNIPGSQFLRPWTPGGSYVHHFHLNRIKQGMLYAARNGNIFHLWWHPHNFGIHTFENIRMLKQILDYYKELYLQYGMETMNMRDIGRLLSESEKSFFKP